MDKGFLSPLNADVVMIVRTAIHADVSLVNASDELAVDAFKNHAYECRLIKRPNFF